MQSGILFMSSPLGNVISHEHNKTTYFYMFILDDKTGVANVKLNFKRVYLTASFASCHNLLPRQADSCLNTRVLF